MRLNVLVLINSSQPERRYALERVLPYLEHFGVPFDMVDLRTSVLPGHLDDYALIFLAHPALDSRGVFLGSNGTSQIRDAVEAGTGLVSFDPLLSHSLLGDLPALSELLDQETRTGSGQIEISGGGHFITELHSASDILPLLDEVVVSSIPGGDILAYVDSTGSHLPLLTANHLGEGCLLHWASTDWMRSDVLGPLAGLDDLFWRGLVWAARRPFCLRGLPPLMTMRVDDVAGTGHLWASTPLNWAKIAIDAGFKPWMGLFIYNLASETVNELRQMIAQNQATAFPHAFGRPVRSDENVSADGTSLLGRAANYYYPNAYRLRSTQYDEFIYFDHERQRPWQDGEALRGLQAVDDWYQAHAPLPLSPMAIPHWGEMGSNVLAHIRYRWGCDRIATYHGIDASLKGSRWLVGGPFRKYEEPGSALFDRHNRGDRPVYYADFQNFSGAQFFLCFSEIRDETGYEWAPDNDVESTASRGIRQLRRALDSMVLPTLFTHETDFIYKIRPENWEAMMRKIAAGIAGYQPIQVTLDDGVRMVRANQTSKLVDCEYDPQTKQVQAVFRGDTDMKTMFYLFTGGEQIESRLVDVPAFQKDCKVIVNV
jgi:hypothetical protein